jgi:anti-sigma factor RsiW
MNAPCPRTARDVLLYRDGEQSPSEREAFVGHLPGCSDCRARLEDANALGALLREAFDSSAEPLPAGFSDRVMGEIRDRSRSRARIEERRSILERLDSLFGSWRWVALGGLAIAAAIATVVLPLLSANRDTPAPLNEAERESLRQENEAHIHRLSVESPGTHSMVLQTAEGRTVIWMISDSQFGADAGSENP